MYPKDIKDTHGIFIQNIEDGLKKCGVNVDKIVTFGRHKIFFFRFIQYITLYYKILFCNFSKYDVIHVSYPSHVYLPFLFRSNYKNKLVVRLHGHDLIPTTYIGKILKNFTLLAVKNSKLTVVPSKFFYCKLIEFTNPTNYFIYPSGGIDLKKFSTNSAKSYSNVLNLGFVGRIVPGKGIEVLLKAICKLDIQLNLIIIGDYNQDQKYYKSLIKYVHDSSIHDLVKFIGFVSNCEIVKYYKKMDLFIFPTLYEESFGNVALEAMACNLPVIGSKIGALREYIKDGYNGYLFDPGDDNDLCYKINKFYNLKYSQKKIFSSNARLTAEKYDKILLNKLYLENLNSLFL
jgi:L-malate glycosyltransferase